MANTLTGLIPVMYKGMDMVLRELVGFIPAVSMDATAESVNVGQTVRSYVSPAATTGDVTPGQQPADDGDAVLGYIDMSISKSKYSPIRWTGEEIKGYETNGMYADTLAAQFAQSIRALTNLVEADLAALYYRCSRAYGTAGTPPFGTAGNLEDIAQIRKILEDNGASTNELKLILGTAEAANIRGKQAMLFKVNEAGTDALLREGLLGRLEGFDIGVSGQVASKAQAAAASYVTNGIQAVGATSIAVTTGSAAIGKGAILTFAADTVNKYVVAADYAGGAGNILINGPGLRVQIPTSNAITIGTTTYRGNMAFDRNAIRLLARAPAMPSGGDAADDVTFITDPVSGLTFQVALYRLYRRVKYEVGLAWGQEVIKPEATALLLG